MNMSMPILSLPPGFRFHPTDQELIDFYLKKKISSLSSSDSDVSIIADVNIYQFNPWELPGRAKFGEREWFFFSPRERKYPNGSRPSRTAGCGYWKATGTDKPILTSNGSQCVGVKKALVFYEGRPPKGTKTNWMMLEYRLLDGNTHLLHRPKGSMRLDDWVLCRVRDKSNVSSPYDKEEEKACARKNDSSSRSSSPICTNSWGLQGQDIINNNMSNTNNGCPSKHYNKDNNNSSLLSNFMAPFESEELDHEEGSPGYSFSAVGSINSHNDPHLTTVTSFNEALDSIRKVLSIEKFEELVPIRPKKKLHVSTATATINGSTTYADQGSIFQVSSGTINFSEHLI